jgi:PLP dependent protein
LNSLAHNLEKFNQELSEVCTHYGKNPKKISIVCVTKNHSANEINELIQAGILIIGENRVQETLTKIADLKKCEKHFIGHIQSNKIREIVRNFDCIESIDSLKLAKKINTEIENSELTVNFNNGLSIFLQVNIAREPQKFGFLEKELAETIKEIRNLKNLKIKGLMVMGVYKDIEKTREIFERGKKLCDNFGFKNFSAGMSGDWKIAVKSGANFLRIGSLLFEDL